jgi:hypothetical protein
MPRCRDPVTAQGSRSTTQARADDFDIPLTDRAFWRALAMLETVGG